MNQKCPSDLCAASGVESSVSNGTGQCNFLGQRDRQQCFVPGQRDNGTSSKSYQGTGWAGTPCQNLGCATRDGTGRY